MQSLQGTFLGIFVNYSVSLVHSVLSAVTRVHFAVNFDISCYIHIYFDTKQGNIYDVQKKAYQMSIHIR